MVLADPAGSVLADYVKTGRIGEAGSWVVEGIGEDFVPPIADLSRVRQAYTITDAESLATARALLKQEGILAGSSSGTLGGRGPAVLPRADRAQAGGHARLRLGQQVPVEDVQRLLDGRSGLSDRQDLWRPARRDQPPVRRRGRRQRRARRPAEHRLHADAIVRRLAACRSWTGAKIVGILDESDLLLAVMSRRRRVSAAGARVHDDELQTVRPPGRDRGASAGFRRGPRGDRGR